MASEFNVLSQLLARIAAGHYSTRDYAADRLREALKLYVLEFPIYRTYVDRRGLRATPTAPRSDAPSTPRAGAGQGPTPTSSIFCATPSRSTSLPIRAATAGTRLRQFALKLQQFTGPMMAKSLEDTALYRYHALIGLNEVGGDPTLPGLSAQDFHERMRAARRPFHARADRDRDARHQARRGRTHAYPRAVGHSGSVGRARGALARDQRGLRCRIPQPAQPVRAATNT